MADIAFVEFLPFREASTEYTANVYRELRGVYGEIRVRGFQIYKDCMLPAIPVIFKVNTLCGLLISTLN